ncbi:MAG: hypothetical protein ACR5K2_01525 [Wolbachia sp.]
MTIIQVLLKLKLKIFFKDPLGQNRIVREGNKVVKKAEPVKIVILPS